jgi:hypothetical protein
VYGDKIRVTNTVTEGVLRLRRHNTTFQFEMIDAGNWASFWVAELNDPSNSAKVRVDIAYSAAEVNRVVIHNREFYDTDHESRLHGIRIESLGLNTLVDIRRSEESSLQN